MENVGRVIATEYKGRVFHIHREAANPYEDLTPTGEIELSECVHIGGDLYAVPLQVYATENPALLKVVLIVGYCDAYSPILESTFAEITGHNIRTAYMTPDKKLYYHSGASDCEGIYDMAPQDWRLDKQAKGGKDDA
jgi:hypothetical protein